MPRTIGPATAPSYDPPVEDPPAEPTDYGTGSDGDPAAVVAPDQPRDTTPTDEQGSTIVRGERQPSIKTGKTIPSNVLAEIRAAASRYGVPEWVLVAVLQKENGSYNTKAKNVNTDGSVDHGLAQINDRARMGDFKSKAELIGCAESVSCSIDYLAHSTYGVFLNERRQEAQQPQGGAPTSDENLWLNAAANWHRSVRDGEWADYRQGIIDLSERGYTPSGKKIIAPTKEKGLTAAEKRNRAPTTINDLYDLYHEIIGRDPTSDAEVIGWGRLGQPYGAVRAEFTASPEAAQWRQYGPRIQDVRSWANSLYRQYLGHAPTNDEAISIIKNGWDPDRLETYLRQRPYGNTTLGAFGDARATARQQAQKFLGRDADDGEINWLVQNGKTTSEDIAAFYEQAKERLDTGDPAFSWAADPKTWRDTHQRLQQTWSSLGLRGEVDPHTVNQALTEKWSDEDTTAAFNALPAPGYPQDMTVGEVNRVRSIAKHWRDHFGFGPDVSREEILQFRGQSGVAGNEAIKHYFSTLPADWSGNVGGPKVNAQPQAQATAEVPKAAPIQGPPGGTPVKPDQPKPKREELTPDQVQKQLGITLTGPGANVVTPVTR